MYRQEFNAPVEFVQTGKNIHNHWGREAEPPDDPEKSLQCYQCQRLTWRFSQYCIHCRLDLFDWCDQLEHEAQVARAAVRRQHHFHMAKICGVISASFFAAGIFLPGEHKMDFVLIGFLVAGMGLHWMGKQ